VDKVDNVTTNLTPSMCDLIVGDVLTRWPQTLPVFVRHRMSCLGCGMSRFETISEAAAIYGLPPEGFVVELEQAIQGGAT
jgi:hybrid cluster-associated redox disulfide protein